MAHGTVDAAHVVTIARTHDADPVLVLAVTGWLPTDDGWVHVTGPDTLGQRVHLLNDAHRWAYVFFEDMAPQTLGHNWTPFPTICPSRA